MESMYACVWKYFLSLSSYCFLLFFQTSKNSIEKMDNPEHTRECNTYVEIQGGKSNQVKLEIC